MIALQRGAEMGQVTNPNGGAADTMELAAKRAVETSIEEQAAFVLDAVGARIATAAVGLRDAQVLRSWARGETVTHSRAAERLRELYPVVWALCETYSPAVAAAFLCGTNLFLGDRAPLVVLTQESPEKAGTALQAAARHLIEG